MNLISMYVGLIADKTISALDYHSSRSEQPFFFASMHTARTQTHQPIDADIIVGLKRPHLSYKTPKSFFDAYPLDSISLPYAPNYPSALPPISYTHSCMTGLKDVAPYGINLTCANGHETRPCQ